MRSATSSRSLSLVQPQIIFGLLMGGAVIYWFTGASTQAVVTGAYRAVVFIKKNINLDKETASIEDSKKVVEICTVYAQTGMINIFIVVFAFALGLPFFNPYFFIGYLIGIAFFGLFQAIFMANAGGAWDNAKKIVEVDLKQKGTPLHAATVVGDTVGDPFKDTSLRRDESDHQIHHALRPARRRNRRGTETRKIPIRICRYVIGAVCFLVALVFVYRSFYCMRIPERAGGKILTGDRSIDSQIKLENPARDSKLTRVRHSAFHSGRLATARFLHRRCFCAGQS